jgi:hypothetical protein
MRLRNVRHFGSKVIPRFEAGGAVPSTRQKLTADATDMKRDGETMMEATKRRLEAREKSNAYDSAHGLRQSNETMMDAAKRRYEAKEALRRSGTPELTRAPSNPGDARVPPKERTFAVSPPKAPEPPPAMVRARVAPVSDNTLTRTAEPPASPPKPKLRPEGLGTSKPPKITKTANSAKSNSRTKKSKKVKSTRSEFEQEFARQRKAGAKHFTFKGKRYSTKVG